jgi:hypothetical protein
MCRPEIVQGCLQLVVQRGVSLKGKSMTNIMPVRNIRPSAGLAHPISINHGMEIHAMPRSSFLTDIQTLRKRARQHIDEGSVTAGYSADREIVL